ncbi:sulfate adenylyltransferase subunit 1 [Humibacter albus]|jgi:bifunctional enzyme CysN/CysC|uniref:sulfate adenylyltransferase subunit 1 n=1 Tax=Humibacter albus TaxID=427754 RepID=UPI0003B38B79|nr:GTP-binding protein [Humibacter albus]
MPELLRVATAGSVDDGKSTLIGRLLYDSKSLFDDQLDHVERVSRQRGDEYTDLALLTDGLRAEREQGITIDVAYRYFATPRRSFILADTPGHVQYTRNMVTGASTTDAAIILVDARNGMTEQSRRHAVLAALLGVEHVVVCVNKMDLVGWSQEVFDSLVSEFEDFSVRLRIPDLSFIPVSALLGDNVVDASANMPWFDGTPLLRHLEHMHIAGDRNLVDVRLPVQLVVRPHSHEHHDHRGYAGSVAGGVLRAGDRVRVLPSGFETEITQILGPDGPVEEAFPTMSVQVLLADDIDVSRGDMICRPGNMPSITQELDAHVCWMDETSELVPGTMYALKHTTKWARAKVTGIDYRLNTDTLHRDREAGSLTLNDIGRVRLRASVPLFVDAYEHNRETGSFILVDEGTNRTVGAGIVLSRTSA